MALTGVLVTCCSTVLKQAVIPGSAAWSETLAVPGITTRSVVKGDGAFSMFLVRPAVDCFVAVGPAADASQANGDGAAARYYIAAGEAFYLAAFAGDKLAVVAA